MRRTPVSLVALALALAGLGACNRGDDPTVGPGATAPGSSLGTTVTAPPDTTAGGSLPLTAPAPGERAQLTDVRIGARESGDRVVFEFDPVVPGYTVDFTTRPVTEDGSGAEVAVEGEALVEVRLQDASTARFEGEKVILTYEGPKRIRPAGSTVVTEAVLVGDFEGVVTWVIGLTTRPTTVSLSALSGPARLVLDLPRPPSGTA